MSGSRWAGAAVVLGLLAVAAIPLAALVSHVFRKVHLLEAELVAVPAALAIGLTALSAARRARYRLERSVRRPGERGVRAGLVLAWTGLYVASTGALALAFYGVLRASS